MSLLIFAVTMRSWAHMGLITFVPFYYINVLKGDAITAGRLVFVFLMGGVVGTMMGAIIADKIGHKYFFCLSMILAVPLLFLFLRGEGNLGLYYSLSDRVAVDLKFFCHDCHGATDSQKSTGDGFRVDDGFRYWNGRSWSGIAWNGCGLMGSHDGSQINCVYAGDRIHPRLHDPLRFQNTHPLPLPAGERGRVRGLTIQAAIFYR